MSGIKGKVIALTGASSGIGEATAVHLAERGAHLVLGARRGDRLDAVVEAIAARGGSAVGVVVDGRRRGGPARRCRSARGGPAPTTTAPPRA
ncbi:SDR family NAD(P)-dependent oxidoreductase, partial [Streptomyces lavendulae]|uniref:SDR family NAD(P)-dependent oxidoreductase n=1 Tax=Streptomyces lavendulae TaxID=1914 RepID=UPI003675AC93